MVYGFAKQSRGHVAIDSAVGHGTAVTLYLPRADNAAQADSADRTVRQTTPRSARVLVVEDDDMLRDILVSILRARSFEVAEACDGAEALEHLNDGLSFDLLFSDIVLPGGMSGLEIAEAARRLQPGIKVLLTTGYARDAAADPELDGGRILGKPFARDEFLAEVSNLLDADSGRAGRA